MTIYVGNLSYQVTQDALKEVFEEYGKVTNVTLPIDRDTGRVKGFGFVDLENPKDEDSAIEQLDGAEWMGRTLKVNKAKPREDNRSGGGAVRKGNRRFNASF